MIDCHAVEWSGRSVKSIRTTPLWRLLNAGVVTVAGWDTHALAGISAPERISTGISVAAILVDGLRAQHAVKHGDGENTRALDAAIDFADENP